VTAPNLGPGSSLPANSANQFGLETMSQMTEGDWKSLIEAGWDTKFDPIGDIFGAFKELINAVVAAFQGDFGPLGDLVEGALVEFADALDLDFIVDAIKAAASGDALPSGNPLGDLFGSVLGLFNKADTAETNASAAQAAAAAANNSVLALLTGGTRTIYTSSTTWPKPVDAVKVGIICIGAAGAGPNGCASSNTNTSIGGGYSYFELPASALPSSVVITIPTLRAKGSGTTSPGVASFGSYASNPTDGTGSIVSSSGFLDSNNSAARRGGLQSPAIGDDGRPGDSSALGTAGAGTSGNGGAGGNAATTGTALATGGAGAGGATFDGNITASGGEGGAGGFPGGPGGCGGKNFASNKSGGAGGGALVAVIVW
jgi:hypothetical protein